MATTLLGLFVSSLPLASAAALTGVDFSAPLQTTGTVETWTVQFTTVSAVPASGDIRIVFPTGFQTSSGAATVCDVTAPGTVAGESTTVVSATEVVCELGGADSIGAATGVSLTLTNIANPTTAQTTGAFTLQTRDAVDAVIDDDTANTESILASTLAAAALSAPLQTTGAIETWTVQFNTVNPVAAGGDLRIAFPAGFETSSGAATVCDVTAPGTVTAETTSIPSATEAVCTLGGADTIAASTVVTLTLTNVRNPVVAGATAAFTLETRDPVDAVHDSNATNTETIVASVLTAVAISAPLQTTGAVETWTFGFTTVNAVPASGDLRIVLPAGFQTSSGAATVCDVTAPGTVAGETTTVVSATEVVCELGGADSIAAATPVSWTLTNVRNPVTAQTTGTYTLQTRDATDAVIDANTTATEAIVASALAAVSASGATLQESAVTTWTVGFTTVNAVPASGDLRIVFPAGFQTSSGAATVCDVTAPGTVSAETTTVVSATEVVCELGGADAIASATVVGLTLSNMENPVAGVTATFLFETRDASDNVLDRNASLTATIASPSGGGGGGIGWDRRSGQTQTLMANRETTPPGALYAYGYVGILAEAGNTIVLRTDSPTIRTFRFDVQSPINQGHFQLVIWPGSTPPPDTPPATGVRITRYLQVELGEEHDVPTSIRIRINRTAIAEPDQLLLLRYAEGSWTPVSRFGLTLSGDTLVGNASTLCCSVFAVIADERAPDVESTLPVGDVYGTVAIPIEAEDNLEIERIEFWVDGQLVATLPDAEAALRWDTTTLADGEHRLELRVYDFAENVAASQAFVVVANEGEEGHSGSPTPTSDAATPAPGAWAALLALLVGLGGLWRRRRA